MDGLDISFEVLHAIPGRVRLRIPETRRDPALATRVAEWLLGKRGIISVRANTTCASLTVAYNPSIISTFVPEQHLKGIRLRQRDGQVSLEQPRQTRIGRALSLISRFAGLILPTIALAVSFVRTAAPIAPVYALVAAAAGPIFHRAASTIVRQRRLGVDFLDATAIAIMGFQRNLPTCAFMAWLISIGEHIREETARRSEKAIAELVAFRCDTASVLRGGRRQSIPAEQLVPGDRVLVNAGDCIAVDGRVARGRAGVDQMSLTGESILAEKAPGDAVYAGSIAVDGELEIEASAVGLNTRAGRIVGMLRSVPAHETKIEDYAARFADRLVLPTFLGAGLVFGLTRSVARALSMLIVDFGTGVRVAAPTAFLSSMIYAARRNIVVKGGRAVEKLARVNAIVFDKTGTLTTGVPAVTDVIVLDKRYTPEGVLKLAAGAEAGLNHPVAAALQAKAEDLGVRIPRKIEARLMVGLGVKARIRGKEVVVGRGRLMRAEGIDISRGQAIHAESPLYVAANGRLIGVINYADKARPESRGVIARLRELGVEEIVLATGDRESVARRVAEELGIGCYVARALPERKLEIVRELQSQGRTVAVVGDGINDALALAHADVSVATAGATDAAREASDVLLMEDDLRLLVEALTISHSAMGLVRGNFAIVGVPNAAAIALAATGILGPPGATLINNGSTIAAGVNGLRPLFQ